MAGEALDAVRREERRGELLAASDDEEIGSVGTPIAKDFALREGGAERERQARLAAERYVRTVIGPAWQDDGPTAPPPRSSRGQVADELCGWSCRSDSCHVHTGVERTRVHQAGGTVVGWGPWS